MNLKTLIGDYPVTTQFRTLTDRFEFGEYQGSVATAIKRVVRNLEIRRGEIFNSPARLRSSPSARVTSAADTSVDARVKPVIPRTLNHRASASPSPARSDTIRAAAPVCAAAGGWNTCHAGCASVGADAASAPSRIKFAARGKGRTSEIFTA